MAQSKRVLNSLFALLFICSFFSCDRTVLTQLEEEDIAAIIESALQSSTGGMTDIIEDIADTLIQKLEDFDADEFCDSLYQNSRTINYNGVRGQADYDVNWDYIFNCNNFNIPQDATTNASIDGTSSTQRINSTDSSTLALIFTDLQLTASEMTANGSYNNSGTLDLTQLSTQTTINVVNTTSLTLTNLKIDKSDSEITGGTGTFTVSGTADGNSFSYTGTITFLGNDQAEVTINGTVYQIDLS